MPRLKPWPIRPHPPPGPNSVLFDLLSSLPLAARSRVASIAIDGTSATTLLLDAASGAVLAPPKLYNEAQGAEAVAAAKVGGAAGEAAGEVGWGWGSLLERLHCRSSCDHGCQVRAA